MINILKTNIAFCCLIFFCLGIAGCSGSGPDAPILVISGQDDFGLYTEEILRAEGFNEFKTGSLEDVKGNKSFLSGFPVVILSQKVTDKEAWLAFERYVNKGGSLISVIPSDFPNSIFGKGEFINGKEPYYIFIDTTAVEGSKLSSHRIQIHVERYVPQQDSSTVIARFGNQSGPDSRSPALVTGSYGKGRTAAFLYNLPANIVLTRQGNPEFAGDEKDSIPGLRAMDLFTDGWVDPDCNSINQADEQMHLLANLINSFCSDIMPLPRLWYFPDTLKCLATLTNDGEYRREDDFEKQFSDVDSMGAMMSLYVMQTEKISKEWVDKWVSEGFEISGHPDGTVKASAPGMRFMDSVMAAKANEISLRYNLQMTTVVNHWFVWCGTDTGGKKDFATQASIEANNGIALDLNYAHYDNNSSQGHFLGTSGYEQGNFTGSGLPMRFASHDGSFINIWQHLTNVYDQQYNENNDPEGFFECFKGLMDRSIEDEIFSFISIKSHNDEYYFAKDPLLKMLKYASDRDVPVWTASRLLDFIKTRDDAKFNGIKWDRGRLSFTLESLQQCKDKLSIIIPFSHSGKEISKVEADGKPAVFTIRTIRGFKYAFVLIDPGKNVNIIATYSKNRYELYTPE